MKGDEMLPNNEDDLETTDKCSDMGGSG